jgi:hypothetical protein
VSLNLFRLRLATAAVLSLLVAAIVGLTTVTGAEPPPRPPAAAPAPAHPGSSPAPSIMSPAPTPTDSMSPVADSPKVAGDTVSIPSQRVVAPVDVCQIVDGGLEPPADVHRTCYWAGGSHIAAAAGTTVITGHINYVGQGTGALGNIDRLRAGDEVLTSASPGRVTRWRVRTVKHRPKTTGIDTAAFVGRAGPRQLFLISCGGAFDAADASYVDNIYVLAVPASPPTPPTPPTAVAVVARAV